MRTSKFVLTLACVMSFSSLAHSENVTNEQRAAVQKTQELLRNQQQRQQAIEADPKAKATDSSIERSLGGAQNKQKAYEISADILGTMDPNNMDQVLEQAQRDPKAFYDKLTPEQKQQIRDLANQISPAPQQNSAPGSR